MIYSGCGVLLDGRSTAGASRRERGPPGEHSRAESRVASPNAHRRQRYSPGIPGVNAYLHL